jgi:aminoglycoside phosphotransferase (APT) family kinase protein
LERYESYGVERPALEYGFDWLRRNRPSPSTPVPLHGDFRLGNFMIAAPHLAALLDWECAHIGSAAEDFGWIAMRSWRFGRVDLPVAGLGARETFHSAYEAAGGRVIDLEEVRYREIFGLVRWAVLNIMQAHGHMAGTRQSLAFAACGRNVAMMEYDLLMTLQGSYR